LPASIFFNNFSPKSRLNWIGRNHRSPYEY
jgi:hypothetical protein